MIARWRSWWVSAPARSLVAGAVALACAGGFLAWLDRSRRVRDWLFVDLATIWFWQLVFSATCVSVGYRVVTRLVPDRDRTRLETLALAFPVGFVVFGLAMYAGGFLALYEPAFAVALPVLMLAASARPMMAGLAAGLAAGLPARLAETGRPRAAPGPALAGLPFAASVVGVLLLGVLYLGAMSPDAINYDANALHLVIPQDYAREGRIVAFPGNWMFNYPHLASVVNTWSYLVPGLGVPALRWMMCLHTEFTVLVWTLVGVAAATRWLAERDVRGAWAAFVLFPGIFVYDNNLGGSADHFAALFAVPMFLVTERATRRFDRGTCVLWGVLAGGALLTKLQMAYLLVPLGVWVLIRAGGAMRQRDRGVAPGTPAKAMLVAGATTVAVMLPYLGSNFVYYRNPFYPLLQQVFTASRPAVRDAAIQVQTLMADWTARPPDALGDRIRTALELLLTFSFVPHYSFADELPVFGSLFTLSLPLLFAIRGARRLWTGALVGLGAVAMWAWTYLVDRNLQTLLPLLMAVTAAVLVRAWELGRAARAGVAALVLVQVAWGSSLYFSGQERMAGAINLLRSGMQGRAKVQLATYRSDFLALGAALPRDAKVLLHNYHLMLGVDRPVILDWIGFQGIIDYRTFRTPRDLDQRLREIGITHVMWLPGGNQASTRQTDILFDVYAHLYGVGHRRFGEFGVFALPPSPPPVEPPYQVLVMGMKEYADGLYPIDTLSTCLDLPARFQQYFSPSRTGPSSALIADAKVVLVAASAVPDAETVAIQNRDFIPVPAMGNFRVLLRR